MNLHNLNRRLSNIYRFCNVPRIKDESVAEHSYFVTLYSMVIADIVGNVDKTKIMKMSLLHDSEESISGDFPHPTKERFPTFNEALEEINLFLIKEIFKDNQEYIELWKESRNEDTEEARIVKLADRLSVLVYTNEESELGNSHMMEIYQKEIKKLEEFVRSNPKYNFIWGLI